MKELLSSTAFLVVNKTLAKNIGLKETVLLADLISKEEYFINNGMTNGWFFNTEANIQKDTTLTPYQQRKAIKTLKEHNIIETKRIGVPAKQHFKINEEQVVKFLNNKLLSKSTTINNNKEIRIKNKNVYTRKEKFLNDLKELEPKDYIEDFQDYWQEENNVGKQRWELEKTWNTNLRYKRWCKNQKNFSGGNNTNNMPDFLDGAYINRIKEDQAQLNKFYKHLVDNCSYEKFETVTGYIKYRKRR